MCVCWMLSLVAVHVVHSEWPKYNAIECTFVKTYVKIYIIFMKEQKKYTVDFEEK